MNFGNTVESLLTADCEKEPEAQRLGGALRCRGPHVFLGMACRQPMRIRLDLFRGFLNYLK